MAAWRGSNVWLLSIAIFVSAACVTILLLSWRGFPALRATQPTRLAGALGVHVGTAGADLLLSWNRKSPAVEAASSGVLHIDDGQMHREIALDRSGILNGSITYKPISDDVALFLELRGIQGSHVSEGVRVLDALVPSAEGHTAVVQPLAPPPQVKTAVEMAARQKTNPNPDARPSSQSSSKSIITAHLAIKAADQLTPSAEGRPGIPPPLVTTPAQPASISPVAAAALFGSPPANVSNPPAEHQTRAISEALVSQPAKPPANLPMDLVANSQTVHTSTAFAAALKQVEAARYVPPRPVKWVTPDLKRLGVSSVPADIKVKVRIDDTGRVTAAHALIEGPKHDEKVMAAAAAAVRQWLFEPAKAHGMNIASEDTIVIHMGGGVQ